MSVKGSCRCRCSSGFHHLAQPGSLSLMKGPHLTPRWRKAHFLGGFILLRDPLWRNLMQQHFALVFALKKVACCFFPVLRTPGIVSCAPTILILSPRHGRPTVREAWIRCQFYLMTDFAWALSLVFDDSPFPKKYGNANQQIVWDFRGLWIWLHLGTRLCSFAVWRF